MRIFEKILLTDGGPNDKGKVIGYVSTKSMTGEPKSVSGFIIFRQIPIREYNKRKNEALRALNLFTI